MVGCLENGEHEAQIDEEKSYDGPNQHVFNIVAKFNFNCHLLPHKADGEEMLGLPFSELRVDHVQILNEQFLEDSVLVESHLHRLVRAVLVKKDEEAFFEGHLLRTFGLTTLLYVEDCIR